MNSLSYSLKNRLLISKKLINTYCINLVTGYQIGLSPILSLLFGGQAQCRFYPSCSNYCKQALRAYGFSIGMRYTLGRLKRCHPWQPGGDDPLPHQQS